MKITVLGAGAMGMLFGGYLSKHNDVWLIDIDAERVKRINESGVSVRGEKESETFRPYASVTATGLGKMDLVLVFVKGAYTVAALETNRELVGPDTYIMSLQNGMGHEANLLRFADGEHVIIGTTHHNSSVISNGCINHGGGGKTTIGLLGNGDIAAIAQAFSDCGFPCTVSTNVKASIWNKVFLNTAASALTAVLQVPLGFILEDAYASVLMERLAREAVAVANAECGGGFDADTVIADIKASLAGSRGGYTSIYADIKNGNRTEVDTISGAVAKKAQELGVAAPYHDMVVALIHAMENRNARIKEGLK